MNEQTNGDVPALMAPGGGNMDSSDSDSDDDSQIPALTQRFHNYSCSSSSSSDGEMRGNNDDNNNSVPGLTPPQKANDLSSSDDDMPPLQSRHYMLSDSSDEDDSDNKVRNTAATRNRKKKKPKKNNSNTNKGETNKSGLKRGFLTNSKATNIPKANFEKLRAELKKIMQKHAKFDHADKVLDYATFKRDVTALDRMVAFVPSDCRTTYKSVYDMMVKDQKRMSKKKWDYFVKHHDTQGGMRVTHSVRCTLEGFLQDPKTSKLKKRLTEAEFQVMVQIELTHHENRYVEHQSSLIINDFVSKNCKMLQAQKRYKQIKQAIVMLQSKTRMMALQRKFRPIIQQRVQEAQKYQAIWGTLEDTVSQSSQGSSKKTRLAYCSWEDIKMKRLDRMNVLNEEEYGDIAEETYERMDSAVKTALEKEDEEVGEENYQHVDVIETAEAEDDPDLGSLALKLPPAPKCEQIQLTKEVLKWFDRQDSKYRGFFLRRIEQLADGERSRILQKNLTGCKTAIWETYLDQKSGQRILWTECETLQDDHPFDSVPLKKNSRLERGILIWYVSPHDRVNRLMRLIDKAEDRSRDKLMSAMTLFKTKHEEVKEDVLQLQDSNRIIADPLGDTPLKLHVLHRNDIEKLCSKYWKPRLHLTAEEHRVVSKEGTVLLLGRSGTGKTICIANRMDLDRERDPNVTQLFVARSRRICSYVRGLVEGGNGTKEGCEYTTFANFLARCEKILSLSRGSKRAWSELDRMDFTRFKLEVYSTQACKLDALVVWSQIRSFIKGSIEAVKARQPLTREEYLSLGINRCRLSKESREMAYSAFETYQSFLDSQMELWDDTDRVSAILVAIGIASEETLTKLHFQKIYVDEIQDYTQAEIALFFYLSTPDGLFLAGDTAQSVVEGVDFRFDEVRSIGHALFGEGSSYIPDKPVNVNVNFRSHAGILNVAAAVLNRMFAAFPRSANKLEPDIGAFSGPRPSILQNISDEVLQNLVNRIAGVVILTHDERVQQLKQLLGENVLVFGIRYSKGLEFPHVIIVDFFSGLDKTHHKAWKDLLSIRSDKGKTGVDYLKETAPEVETQLKLLYTAITRCSKRLFFAERKSTVAGEAFRKWTTIERQDEENGRFRVALTVKQTVDNIERLAKTADEWIASGVDYGAEAENSDDLQQSRDWLKRAVFDFEKGNQAEYVARAKAHLDAIDLRIEVASLAQASTPSSERLLPTDLQAKASSVIVALMQNSMVDEAHKTIRFITPFVNDYTKDRIAKRVVPQLPSPSSGE